MGHNDSGYACSVISRYIVSDISQCIFAIYAHSGSAGNYLGDLQAIQTGEVPLRKLGTLYDDFKNIGILKGKWEYQSYEEKGFSTPSGKVEIYSQQLKEWGYNPLPDYQECPESPYSPPELFKEYPLIFTSAKDPFYFHSSNRNISSLRKLSPDPIALIHSETASHLGINEGDWVSIETKSGTIRQMAKLSPDIDPRVIVLSFGWWFPERKDLELSGWKESNLNILTDNGPPYEPTIGSTPLRAVPCRVYKSEGF